MYREIFIGFFYHTDNERRALKPSIMKLKSEFKQRWISAARGKHRFLIANESWLGGSFTIPRPIKIPERPSLPVDELSERSKRRKMEDLGKTVSPGKLKYTTCASLYSSEKRNASKILTDIKTNPERATKYKQEFYGKQNEINKLFLLDALSLSCLNNMRL